MKLRDILRISGRGVRAHLRRNLMVVAVMGVIFAVILVMNLWLQGMENAYVEFAERATGGKVVILASNSMAGMVMDEETTAVSRAEMVADVEEFGGKVLGDAERVGRYGAVVLPKDLVKEWIEVDLENVPDGAIPVLATAFLGRQLLGKEYGLNGLVGVERELEEYERYRADLIGKTFTDTDGAEYYVVGLALGNFYVGSLSFRALERTNDDILNPVLKMVATPAGMPIVIDDGKNWQTGEPEMVVSGSVGTEGETLVEDLPAGEAIVVVFEDGESAYRYLREGRGRFMNVEFPGQDYAVEVVAGMSPEMRYVFGMMKMVAGGMSVVLGVVAVIVVVFTSIRLVDQEKQNIKLYYNLGATTGQVRAIYLCYFLELMVIAAVLAFGVASAIVVGWSLVNQEILGAQAALAFSLREVPRVMWYGVSAGTVVILGAMLLIAPVCVAVNWKRLR